MVTKQSKRIPDRPKFTPSSTTKMIVCFEPGTSDEDKAHDLAELEKYMEFRKARAAQKAHLTTKGDVRDINVPNKGGHRE